MKGMSLHGEFLIWCFIIINTGSFEEVMLIKNPDDLASFKEMYDITEKIEKIY